MVRRDSQRRHSCRRFLQITEGRSSVGALQNDRIEETPSEADRIDAEVLADASTRMRTFSPLEFPAQISSRTSDIAGDIVVTLGWPKKVGESEQIDGEAKRSSGAVSRWSSSCVAIENRRGWLDKKLSLIHI